MTVSEQLRDDEVHTHELDNDDCGCGHDHHDHQNYHVINGSIERTAPKIGRNDPCFCGSGIKYKKCCLI